jgi:hypothetical protein
MNTVTIDAIAAEALSTTEDVVRILDELKARPREDWRGRLVVEDTIADALWSELGKRNASECFATRPGRRPFGPTRPRPSGSTTRH